MQTFSVAVRPGDEADRFNDAFYRFLGLHACPDDGACMLQTTPLEASEHKLVTLWCDEALSEFMRYWRSRSPAAADAKLS